MTVVHSFLDTNVDLVSPTGSVSLSRLAMADEGITIARKDTQNVHTTGANGPGMHSKRASTSGTVTIRCLKNGAINAILSSFFNAQNASSALWGKNQFTVFNPVSGDNHLAINCAFQKYPDITYAVEGGTIEWVFDADELRSTLGAGAQY